MDNKPLYVKLFPLVAIAVFAVVIFILYATRPTADRSFKPQAAHVAVSVRQLEPAPYTVNIQSYGLVQPRIQTELTAQIDGKVDFVSESLRDGGFFKKGEVLISIEKADYEIALTAAEANYLEAEQNLIEQQALAEQAREDWKRLGRSGNPAPLALKEPQVAAAKAKLKAAQANLEGAELDLARTQIRAPYDGRVLSKYTELGNVVGANKSLADIYSIDAIEVKLPIRNSDIGLLQLPESYNVAPPLAEPTLPRVVLTSNLVEQTDWEGTIARTSGAVEADSRQIYVVARIDSPFGKKALNKTPLKIRQYVTASVQGRTLTDAIVIPNKTIYQGSYVYLYKDGMVHRQPVTLLWQNNTEALVKTGLQAGDQLVITPLGQLASGTRVKLEGEASDHRPNDRSKKPRSTQGADR